LIRYIHVIRDSEAELSKALKSGRKFTGKHGHDAAHEERAGRIVAGVKKHPWLMESFKWGAAWCFLCASSWDFHMQFLYMLGRLFRSGGMRLKVYLHRMLM
jgi:hypothetical protein